MSRRKYRKNTNQATASAPVMTQDSFQNMMARLGVGMPNMMNGTDYPLTRLTQNYNLLNSLYRNHWIVRKIVDTIPEDMCKNWIKIITQEPPEEMKKLDKVIKNTKTKERILEGLKWGRLYGGAAGVILLNRQEDMLAEPLNYDLILPGDYKGILILDRWSGISPDLELVSDLTSPDFGLPSSYRVTLQTGEALTVHHSRIIRFTGDALPAWEAWTELQWGASVIESVFDELKKRDNTSYNIANLVFLANLRVYKTNLVDLLGLGTEQMQRDFYNAMEILNWMMNNSGMSVIGKDDGFETHQYTFAGINDIYESFMLDVSGACGIPVTRLFGRSPAGFNATGESDLTNYYDAIETKQESQLAPILDKLIPIIALSTWGRIPEDIDYDFNPLRRADPKENADLAKSMTDNVIAAFNAGLISPRTAMKEMQQQSDLTGMWSNITDADIAKASDALDTLGGDLPGMEGLLQAGGDSGSGNPLEGEKSRPFKVSDDDPDDKGRWITTENGKHIHLNEQGKPDKGNPHVIAEMKGEESSGAEESGQTSAGEDVTDEYYKTATPGIGKIEIEEGYNLKKGRAEFEVAQRLHDTFGGDITLLKKSEVRGEETPDFKWRGKFWELKNIESSTYNKTDMRIHKAYSQISRNPGGIVLEYSKSPLQLEEVESYVQRSSKRRIRETADVMIIKNDTIKVLRIKRKEAKHSTPGLGSQDEALASLIV